MIRVMKQNNCKAITSRERREAPLREIINLRKKIELMCIDRSLSTDENDELKLQLSDMTEMYECSQIKLNDLSKETADLLKQLSDTSRLLGIILEGQEVACPAVGVTSVHLPCEAGTSDSTPADGLLASSRGSRRGRRGGRRGRVATRAPSRARGSGATADDTPAAEHAGSPTAERPRRVSGVEVGV